MNQSFADSCLTAWLTRQIFIILLANKRMEQVTGIGPVTNPWQGFILPLNYTCKYYNIIAEILLLVKFLFVIFQICIYFSIVFKERVALECDPYNFLFITYILSGISIPSNPAPIFNTLPHAYVKYNLASCNSLLSSIILLLL